MCQNQNLILSFKTDQEILSIYLVELTVPFEQNITKAHDRKQEKYLGLVSDIVDNGFACDLTCFEVGVFTFFGTKLRKPFVWEFSKLALLSSYTIWNARQEPAWGSEDQPSLLYDLFFCHSIYFFLCPYFMFSDPICVIINLIMMCMCYVLFTLR